MPIWRSKSNSAPSGDPAIHVKYSGLWLSDERKAQATEAVTRARYMVAYVAAQISSLSSAQQSEAVQTYGGYFFRTGGGLGQPELDIIRPNLVLIQNGLTQGVSIKITTMKGAAGYVKTHPTARKPRWTKGTVSLNDSDGSATTKVMYRGDIHVGAARLDQGVKLAAKTVVHEASHKFASTADFGKRGYTYDNGVFVEEGLTPEEALNNAESYARFVLHVFDDECAW
ncbi:hypothetical protein [Elioraea rosea]|uniref:hypothetical protein n=1 Tax=Elioraea rosea TaxID=2492390 RepID=UPI001183CE40|nr:hypothetical protein [Elioraea rosea]